MGRNRLLGRFEKQEAKAKTVVHASFAQCPEIFGQENPVNASNSRITENPWI
jgi:hypothetical protein